MRAFFILITALFTATAGIAQSPPDATRVMDDLTAALQGGALPWSIVDVDITAEVVEGNAVNPVVQQRFEATAYATDTLYAFTSFYFDDTTMLQQLRDTNTPLTVYGTVTYRPARGDWEPFFTLENLSDLRTGFSLAQFAQDNPGRLYVVDGTPEADALRAAQAAFEAAAAAEAERLAAEQAAQDALVTQTVGGAWEGRLYCTAARHYETTLSLEGPNDFGRMEGVFSYQNLNPADLQEAGSASYTFVYDPAANTLQGSMGNWIERAPNTVVRRIFLTATDAGWEGTIDGDCSLFFDRPEAYAARKAQEQADVTAYLNGLTLSTVSGEQEGPTRLDTTLWPLSGTAAVSDTEITGTLTLPVFRPSDRQGPRATITTPYRVLFPAGLAHPLLLVDPYDDQYDRSFLNTYGSNGRCSTSAQQTFDRDTQTLVFTPGANNCQVRSTLRFE